MWGYVNELAYLLKQARDAETAISAMTSELAIAQAMSNTRRAEEVLTQRTQVRKQLDAITQVAAEKANREDLLAAERLLQQLQARLQGLENYEQDVARLEARFEMAVALGEFTSETGGTSRAEVEELLTKARDRVSAQLKFAADLVPDKPIVLV